MTTGHFDQKAATWDDDPVRVERAATVAAQMLERIDIDPRSHVLDFGSGTGLLGVNFLSRAASVTFADPSEAMLEQVQAKLHDGGHESARVHRFDPAAPSLPGRYAAIVSLMTLHHVKEPAETLAFLVEHLEPGGWLAVCDLDTEDGSFHEGEDAGPVHHGFDRNELSTRVAALGLTRVQTSTAWVMRRDDASAREYPLFLLTAVKPTRP